MSETGLVLNPDTPVDPEDQEKLTAIDRELRARFGMDANQVAAGWVDLRGGTLAMLRPDLIEYGASVPKIGILLAWFHRHPEAADGVNDPEIRHALGQMAKASSNEEAARFSKEIGLGVIQSVLTEGGFYDPKLGGLWVGKHYGSDEEIVKDPVGSFSHAVTLRQMLRFFLWLEQGLLISPKASAVMREIFASPDIPHSPIKFVAGLADRPVSLIRKWGSWMNWLHDAAVVTGPGRHYILAGVTRHPRGDDYLREFARAADDFLSAKT